MKIFADIDNVSIIEGGQLNSGEYNARKLEVELSEDYSSCHKVMAVFILSPKRIYETEVINGECDIPMFNYEGDIQIGVYGYQLSEEAALIKRLSPRPTESIVYRGSYIRKGESPSHPLPNPISLLYKKIDDIESSLRLYIDEHITDINNTIEENDDLYTNGLAQIMTQLDSWLDAIVDRLKPLEDGAEMRENKVTEITANSTDTQYPSAKAVFDALSESGGGLTIKSRTYENDVDAYFATDNLASGDVNLYVDNIPDNAIIIDFSVVFDGNTYTKSELISNALLDADKPVIINARPTIDEFWEMYMPIAFFCVSNRAIYHSIFYGQEKLTSLTLYYVEVE